MPVAQSTPAAVTPRLGMPHVLCCGDRLRPGAFRLHSRFAHAANFVAGNWVVSMVDESIGSGPVNIVIRGLATARLGSLFMSEALLSIDGTRIPLPKARWSSRPDLRTVRADIPLLLPRQIDFLYRHAPPESLPRLLTLRRGLLSSPFAGHCASAIAEGIRMLFGDREAQGIGLLCGAGTGLTPSGDDFLVGHLAARRVLARVGSRRFSLPFAEFQEPTSHTSLLSRAALNLAAEGSFTEPVKDYVEALARGDEAAIESCGHRLLGMGSTSGADLMTGLLLSLNQGVHQ